MALYLAEHNQHASTGIPIKLHLLSLHPASACQQRTTRWAAHKPGDGSAAHLSSPPRRNRTFRRDSHIRSCFTLPSHHLWSLLGLAILLLLRACSSVLLGASAYMTTSSPVPSTDVGNTGTSFSTFWSSFAADAAPATATTFSTASGADAAAAATNRSTNASSASPSTASSSSHQLLNDINGFNASSFVASYTSAALIRANSSGVLPPFEQLQSLLQQQNVGGRVPAAALQLDPLPDGVPLARPPWLSPSASGVRFSTQSVGATVDSNPILGGLSAPFLNQLLSHTTTPTSTPARATVGSETATETSEEQVSTNLPPDPFTQELPQMPPAEQAAVPTSFAGHPVLGGPFGATVTSPSTFNIHDPTNAAALWLEANEPAIALRQALRNIVFAQIDELYGILLGVGFMLVGIGEFIVPANLTVGATILGVGEIVSSGAFYAIAIKGAIEVQGAQEQLVLLEAQHAAAAWAKARAAATAATSAASAAAVDRMQQPHASALFGCWRRLRISELAGPPHASSSSSSSDSVEGDGDSLRLCFSRGSFQRVERRIVAGRIASETEDWMQGSMRVTLSAVAADLSSSSDARTKGDSTVDARWRFSVQLTSSIAPPLLLQYELQRRWDLTDAAAAASVDWLIDMGQQAEDAQPAASSTAERSGAAVAGGGREPDVFVRE